jgi:hypothetical protein
VDFLCFSPATRARAQVIVCDEDATMELRVKTVRYFDKLQKSPQGLYGDLGVGVVP